MENLTLTTQPLMTIKFFVLAVIQCLKRAILHPGGWFMLRSIQAGSVVILAMAIVGAHERVLSQYFTSDGNRVMLPLHYHFGFFAFISKFIPDLSLLDVAAYSGVSSVCPIWSLVVSPWCGVLNWSW